MTSEPTDALAIEKGGRITPREVERLRREWLAASQGLKEMLDDFAGKVGWANMGRSPGDGIDDTATARAEILSQQRTVDEARTRYEDCRAEHQAQQADAQVTATNRLAAAATVAAIISALTSLKGCW